MSKKITIQQLQAEIGKIYNGRKIIAYSGIKKRKSNPNRDNYFFEVQCLSCNDVVCIELYGLKRNSCLCISHYKNVSFSVKETHRSLYKQVYNSYKNRAKRKKLNFELSDLDFYKLMNSNCHFCNSKPTNILHNWSKKTYINYNGVDRLNNLKGYTKKNSVSCCVNCNIAKSDLSVSEFLRMCTKVVQNLMHKKYFDNTTELSNTESSPSTNNEVKEEVK